MSIIRRGWRYHPSYNHEGKPYGPRSAQLRWAVEVIQAYNERRKHGVYVAYPIEPHDARRLEPTGGTGAEAVNLTKWRNKHARNPER